MIGTTIGNYVVKDKIGEGGMGVVYVAEHPRIGRKVAIKVLLPEYSQNPEVVSRFFTEARASSAIKNEHIIDIIDFGELADGSSYIIMEWLDGLPLTTILQRDGKLSSDRALHIARGIGRALGAAHNRGIVHRDLKPDNVFLVPRADNAEFVKVLDFGIAKLIGNEGGGNGPAASKTRTGAIIGTPMYMSPEQCRGVSVDERSDIYALGVIVYQMLAGRVPFESEGLGELLLKHMTEAPPSLREILPDLADNVERAVMRALEKEPDKRYRRVEDFIAELGGNPTAVMVQRKETQAMHAPAPASAVHATATDTIGAAAGETIAGVPAPRRKTSALWFVAPVLAIGGIAVAITLQGNHGITPAPPVHDTTTVAHQPVPPVLAATPTPDPKAPPAPSRVRFDVRATPADARILIDGKVRTNPYAEELPADGRDYDVEISAPGFATVHKTVALNQAQTVAVTLLADNAASKGGKKGHEPHRLPGAPPGTPDPVPNVGKPETGTKTAAKTENTPKTDAPKPDPKDEKGTPLYKGTKAKIISEFPPDGQ